MAVSVKELAVALRVSADGDDLPQGQQIILMRLKGTAEAHVNLNAAGAPNYVKDEAVIRMAGYLYDSPPAARRDSYANAYVNSGAGALLLPWTTQRAAVSAESRPARGTLPGVPPGQTLLLWPSGQDTQDGGS